MKEFAITAEQLPNIASALRRSTLLSGLEAGLLEVVAKNCRLFQAKAGETIVREGDVSDRLYLLLKGEADIQVAGADGNQTKVGHFTAPETIGETGLLLGQPRSATVLATGDAVLASLTREAFTKLFVEIPTFGPALSRVLAARLVQTTRRLPAAEPAAPSADLLGMLPFAFVQRHRVVVLSVQGTEAQVAFVDEPTAGLLERVVAVLPGMTIHPIAVSATWFDKVLSGIGAVNATPTVSAAAPRASARSPQLDALLERMVGEGASDLHLTASLAPRWRIDGDLRSIRDQPPLGPEDALQLLAPVMPERNRQEFDSIADTDFAYALPGIARFRVNLFRDHLGTGAVLRQIPARIMKLKELGLPPAVEEFCTLHKGLVLVTGPTGSGKSTTLASMIDHINDQRNCHIITLEDPIEFVHVSRNALVNQREIGGHTSSFSRALRAALRQDPDIVLVGELRDLETVALALELANTGHLVFATLHTATAMSTVDRIVDMFPAEQQNQVRSGLAETLRGVVSQTLCKRRGGGRVAALEILVSSAAVANLLREGKTAQLVTAMQTGKAGGNQLLNAELERLVQSGLVHPDEAMVRAVDKRDLARRLGRPIPG